MDEHYIPIVFFSIVIFMGTAILITFELRKRKILKYIDQGYAFVCTPTGRVLQIIAPQDNPALDNSLSSMNSLPPRY